MPGYKRSGMSRTGAQKAFDAGGKHLQAIINELAPWMYAALDDPNTCAEFRASAIRAAEAAK